MAWIAANIASWVQDRLNCGWQLLPSKRATVTKSKERTLRRATQSQEVAQGTDGTHRALTMLHIYITAHAKCISLRALDMNFKTGRIHQGISLQVNSPAHKKPKKPKQHAAHSITWSLLEKSSPCWIAGRWSRVIGRCRGDSERVRQAIFNVKGTYCWQVYFYGCLGQVVGQEWSKAHESFLISRREGAITVRATIPAAKVNIAMLSRAINTPSGRHESLGEQKLTSLGQDVWSAARSDSEITQRVSSAWGASVRGSQLVDWPSHELKTQ